MLEDIPIKLLPNFEMHHIYNWKRIQAYYIVAIFLTVWKWSDLFTDYAGSMVGLSEYTQKNQSSWYEYDMLIS